MFVCLILFSKYDDDVVLTPTDKIVLTKNDLKERERVRTVSHRQLNGFINVKQ